MTKRVIIGLILVIAISGFVILRPRHKATAPLSQNSTVFDKSQHSLDAPDSPWVIANKRRPLPGSYSPPDLTTPAIKLRLANGGEEMRVRQEAATALQQLSAAAKQAGLDIMLVSGYRSQASQAKVYANYVAQNGHAAADRESARPGHSEHQTGWAVDLGRPDRKCELEQCFGTTIEGKWLAEHAHDYGFVLRYLEGKEQVTGYNYEPWHFRYVGKKLASEIQKTGKTLEEFFGLPAAPDYKKE